MNCHWSLLTIVAFLTECSLSAQEPQLNARNGFDGRSEGNGTLRIFLGRPRPFHVESSGYQLTDGRRQLNQTITFQGSPPQNRTWIITDIDSRRSTATLSDAAGPVTLVSQGNRLDLRYRVRGPFVMHQTLIVRPDGKTIDNYGRITLVGIPVGRLRETIVRKN